MPTIKIDQWTVTGDAPSVRQALLNQALAVLPDHATDTERLTAAKTMARRIIEAEVSELRRPFIPDIAGQEIVYVYKGGEAREFQVSNRPPTAQRYPHLFAEAEGLIAAGLLNEDGTTPTAATVAAAIIANATAWPHLSAAIEAVRVPVGRKLAAAVTVAEIEAVLAGVVWPDLE